MASSSQRPGFWERLFGGKISASSIAGAAAGGPGAAAGVASQVAGALGHDTSGLIGSIVSALEKPIYSNTETITVTHVAKNGDVITTVKTKGWTIPLGLPVLFVGTIAAWEIGLSISKAFGLSKGASASDLSDALALVSPAAWVMYEVDVNAGTLLASLFGVKTAPGSSSSTVNVALPPTFMAAMSSLGILGAAPLITAMQKILGVGNQSSNSS